MRLIAIFVLAVLAGCATSSIPAERGGVEFEQLADNVWMHTSYHDLPGIGPFPSNGLIVLTEDETILIDSGWNDQQTESILDWAADGLGRPVTSAVFTHAHQDKMGGVGAVRARGIETYAHRLSNQLAADGGLQPAENALIFRFTDVADELSPLTVFYPGPAHTVDNIVVRIPGTPVLFGGCLVRPPGAKTLGNTADADIANWDDAVIRVRDSFPGATLIVPSHGAAGGRELLDATAALAWASRND